MLGSSRIALTLLVNEHGQVLTKLRGAYKGDNPEIIEAIGKIFKIELNTDH